MQEKLENGPMEAPLKFFFYFFVCHFFHICHPAVAFSVSAVSDDEVKWRIICHLRNNNNDNIDGNDERNRLTPKTYKLTSRQLSWRKPCYVKYLAFPSLTLISS